MDTSGKSIRDIQDKLDEERRKITAHRANTSKLEMEKQQVLGEIQRLEKRLREIKEEERKETSARYALEAEETRNRNAIERVSRDIEEHKKAPPSRHMF